MKKVYIISMTVHDDNTGESFLHEPELYTSRELAEAAVSKMVADEKDVYADASKVNYFEEQAGPDPMDKDISIISLDERVRVFELKVRAK